LPVSCEADAASGDKVVQWRFLFPAASSIGDHENVIRNIDCPE